MYPSIGEVLGLRATIFTSHAADLTQPAWLYIVFRKRRSVRSLVSRFGQSPAFTASVLFTAATMTELSQLVWSEWPFRGVFDPLDIVAFATGLGFCYLADGRISAIPAMTAPGVAR